jgi:hypothetical protein
VASGVADCWAGAWGDSWGGAWGATESRVIGGGAGPDSDDDHEYRLRKRLLEDDETLIFAIAAWAASRRLH